LNTPSRNKDGVKGGTELSLSKKSLYPITVWAYQGNRFNLFNFCESLIEALDWANKLPFTPTVLSSNLDLPFGEEMLSPQEFGEVHPRLSIATERPPLPLG
jgi:hypothetical protein